MKVILLCDNFYLSAGFKLECERMCYPVHCVSLKNFLKEINDGFSDKNVTYFLCAESLEYGDASLIELCDKIRDIQAKFVVIYRKRYGLVFLNSNHIPRLHCTSNMQSYVEYIESPKGSSKLVTPVLSNSEYSTLTYLLRGWSNKKIAKVFEKSPKTVSASKALMLRKLGVNNFNEIINDPEIKWSLIHLKNKAMINYL